MAAELKQLQSVFTSVLGVAPTADFETLSYGNTPGWDSVAHMTLVAEIETAFDVMLSTEDVIGLSSFSKAKEILVANGVTIAG